MDPLNYRDYKRMLERDVSQAMQELGFNIHQSIGYAHVQIELRLDEFPAENVFAITALAVILNAHNSCSEYASGDLFNDDLERAYKNGEHMAILKRLDDSQKMEFLQDVDLVSKILGIGI